MNIFRRLGVGFAATLFSLLIFLFSMSVSLYAVFGQPAPLKQALRRSGVYDVAVQQTLDSKQTSDVPVQDKAVQTAIQQAVPPSEVQRIAEQVIDGTYAWVQGRTSQPNFSIDLTQFKTRIADNLVAPLTTELNALPVCPRGTPVPHDINELFAQQCRPSVVPVSAIVEQSRQAVLDQAVIENPTITAQTLKNDQGRSIFDVYQNVPDWYHLFQIALWVMPVLILLFGLVIVAGSQTRRAGVRRLSVTLLTTAIYNALAALGAMWALGRVGKVVSEQVGAAVFQAKLIKVLEQLAHDLGKYWLGFCIAYLLLAVVGFVVMHRLKKGRLHAVMSKEQQLEHNANIPSAGTRFDPASTPASGQETPKKIVPLSTPDEAPPRPSTKPKTPV